MEPTVTLSSTPNEPHFCNQSKDITKTFFGWRSILSCALSCYPCGFWLLQLVTKLVELYHDYIMYSFQTL